MKRCYLKKCPLGQKGCKQVLFFECNKSYYCSGYVSKNSYVKVDKIGLCITKKGKGVYSFKFTPDEAVMLSDVLTCGVLQFLTEFKPYKKWRGWD